MTWLESGHSRSATRVTSDAALLLPLIILAAAVLLAYQFITADMQPFIYFQF